MTQVPGKSSEYIIQDQNGNLFRLDTKKRLADKLLSFHSGAVVGTDLSPLLHSMASLGSDGSVRLYQYASKSSIAQKTFSAGGSVISYLPQVGRDLLI
jgi:hypothetical protein